MIRKTFVVQNQLGIHTRPAAKLVDTAKKFQCKIHLLFNNQIVDCKSIMGLITLGLKKDSVFEMIFNGEDEVLAEAAIEKLINGKFGED